MYMAAYRRTEAGVNQRLAAQRMEAERLRLEEIENQQLLGIMAELDELRNPQPEPKPFVVRVSTFRRIELRACRVFRVSMNELRAFRRSPHVVFARQFVMYWAARLTALSTPQIGRLLGGRDHTTVLHGKSAYVQKRKAMGRHLREAR